MFGRECAWPACTSPARRRSDYCSQRCYVNARRFAALSEDELAARQEREKKARTRKAAVTRQRADQETRRSLPCVVCGNPMERSQNGRISKYCREACRQRRKRELASVASGAVSQFLRYAHPRPGVHANAEAFYSAYVAWAGAYGIEPLTPSAMLPQLKAAGFQVVGTGADQTVVMGDAENFDNSL